MREKHEVKGVLQSPAILGDPSILDEGAEASSRHRLGFRAQVLTYAKAAVTSESQVVPPQTL